MHEMVMLHTLQVAMNSNMLFNGDNIAECSMNATVELSELVHEVKCIVCGAVTL